MQIFQQVNFGNKTGLVFLPYSEKKTLYKENNKMDLSDHQIHFSSISIENYQHIFTNSTIRNTFCVGIFSERIPLLL